MTVVSRVVRFVVERSWEDLSDAARQELKIRVLDSLGCALGALDVPPVQSIRAQLDDFGGHPLCTLVGGGQTAPDRAALCNGALVRYLDFNDSYFAPGETCHPSDNLAPVTRGSAFSAVPGDRDRVRRLRLVEAQRLRGSGRGGVCALRRVVEPLARTGASSERRH